MKQESVQYLDWLSSVITENFYVVDLLQKKICYTNTNGFLLSGLERDFLSKSIYVNDLSLWKAMFRIILQYLEVVGDERNEINYFSCTFRMQCKCSFVSRPLVQMVYQRIKYMYENDVLRYLICFIKHTTIKDTGNLWVQNKDCKYFSEYDFKTNRWVSKVMEPLTEREIIILMLSKQGKSSKGIANDLCRSENTIRNQIKSLFLKLNVHSMQAAIEYACNLDFSQRYSGKNED